MAGKGQPNLTRGKMKSLNKTLLAVAVSSLLSASIAHAVTSGPSSALVGFKPTLTNLTQGVAGELALGKTLTVDIDQMGFLDADGDAIDKTKVKYIWKVGGSPVSEGEGGTFASYTIGTNANLAGQSISLTIIPVTATGDPDVGNEYVIANLLDAGATGGDGSGNLAPDQTAAPIVSNLAMVGSLKVGNDLSATYDFDANGGETTDASVHTWSGSTNGQLDQVIAASEGVVAAYTIKPGDVGEVIELAVLAKNANSIAGNTVTVNTAGNATDTNGGTGGGTSAGVTDNDNAGQVTYQPAADVASVALTWDNQAGDEDKHGVGSTGRPVIGVSTFTANLTQVSPNTDPAYSNYTFTWKADGVVFATVDGAVGGNTYKFENTGTLGTPDAQGKEITVDVVVKPIP
ncbi:hypothetical protein [Aeromonas veronii]|uniref:hypothetical protein n=1 Tax=Aeromonas veronii TaxID=654 RepID=UPI003BA0CD13